ncbi:hypothetical protein [Hymenobacter properus]|uniref:Delta-60 repeat domain-containing protein n=1 Tax=Hymenobacter properus TaxID=2791026 RepID=A0A931FJ78_9BACT|nr:hypothetical protein [Hymenobacter properus]MBF9140220.1 hypothetical protein [Hymenobacter properus]MBR7719027.1 hypothetical protein [Microvirga sp. SRT04]
MVQTDGKVLVGGTSVLSNGVAVTPSVLRLLSDGTRDASFVPSGVTAGRFQFFQNMALQPDGQELVAGYYSPGSPLPFSRTLLRLNSTGNSDNFFNGAGFNTPVVNTGLNALVVQPDGKILVGGQFSNYGTTARSNVVRLNPNGTLDTGIVSPVSE